MDTHTNPVAVVRVAALADVDLGPDLWNGGQRCLDALRPQGHVNGHRGGRVAHAGHTLKVDTEALAGGWEARVASAVVTVA